MAGPNILLRLLGFLAVLGFLATIGVMIAFPPPNVIFGIRTPAFSNRTFIRATFPPLENDTRCVSKPQFEPRFYNSVTKDFYVNGTTLPEVNFDVGESYAGNLPISNKTNETDELFFWFFPTTNEEHQDDKEIVIWLSGGPGCSSMLSLLVENGPFLWQPGTLEPTRNPFSWHLLTNVVWIDQPVGTGFSKGKTNIADEDELAEQFMGFWRNFIDTFGMHGWKIYIATESWGGMYGPYISSHFIDAKDQAYFDVRGLMIYDGFMFDRAVQFDVPILPFVTRYQDILPFDDNQLSEYRGLYEDCGYDYFFDEYFVFPPSGIQPNLTASSNHSCILLADTMFSVAESMDPCFNFYNIIDHCPFLDDESGAPNNPLGGNDTYFNRTDVKKAIHASPSDPWIGCNITTFSTGDGEDHSPQPSLKHLPNVIDTTKNVILAAGGVDALLSVNGILLGIQNMTWGGVMGFHYQPQDPFYVPNYGFNVTANNTVNMYGSNSPASFGVLGTTHHERGLTFVATKLSGHQGPGYAPAASFRHLEKLLGRVKSLSSTEPFTLPELRNISQPANTTLGKGTMPIP
ncbi:Alpha/Beta hydrolase protein [Trichoderma austrokoningii]